MIKVLLLSLALLLSSCCSTSTEDCTTGKFMAKTLDAVVIYFNIDIENSGKCRKHMWRAEFMTREWASKHFYEEININSIKDHLSKEMSVDGIDYYSTANKLQDSFKVERLSTINTL